ATIKALSENGKKIAKCTVTVDLKIPVTGISLEKDEYTFSDIDQTYKLTPKITPTYATNKKLIYKSSNSTVAKVNEEGIVTSVDKGNAVINMTTEDGGFTAEFNVTVEIPEKKIIKVNGISLKTYKYNFIENGQTYKIEPIVTPSDADNKKVIYSSSDNKIASVDQNGLVTAKGYGNAMIYAKSEDGGYSDTFFAIVEKPVEDTKPSVPTNGSGNIIDLDEVKGVWVATVNRIDFPSDSGLNATQIRNEIQALLDNVKSWGLNTVFFQVRPKADALYNSSYFPTSDVIVEKQGDPLPVDVLEVMIEEAHKRGIALHAWINPYRITQSGKNGQNLEILAESNPARLHPEWVVKHSDGAMYFNPGLPEVRELILNGVLEIVKNYDIDGIHFDDYFYPYEDAKNFDDDAAYELYGSGMTKSNWRRNNNDTLILSVNTAIKQIKSDVQFGISPCGVWALKSNNSLGTDIKSSVESYTQVYADTRKWVVNEWIDYICPQIYWEINHSTAPFKPIAKWWSDLIADTNVKLFIGHAAYKGESVNAYKTSDEIKNQLDYLKTLSKYDGSVMFSYASLNNNISGITDMLKNRYAVKQEDNVPNNQTPVTPASTELVLYQKKLTADYEDKNAFILGVSDPNYPLLANGIEVNRTAQGYFSYFASVPNIGENYVTFEHKGTTLQYLINKKEPYTEPVYLDKFEFVSGYFSPQFDYAATSGTKLTFNCSAPAGANVYAKVGSYTIQMTTSKKKPSNGKYLIAWYEGSFTLPAAEGNTVIGTPVFYAEMDGKTIKYEGSNVIEVINKPDDYLIEIINDKCDLKPNLSVDPDLYYMGTVETRDAVLSKAKGNALLRSGFYISLSDIKHVEGSLQKATAGNVSVSDSGQYTHVIIPLDQKTAHTVWMYDDRTEIILYNLTLNNIPSSTFGENSLFSDINISSIDAATIKITLTYKKPLHIFGYYANFDGSRLVINYKNPVSISAGSRPLSGIKISIDPGHSTSTGALGPWGEVKFYESAFNMTLSLKVKERLEALGAIVRMTHLGEGVKELDELIPEYRAWKPDANISIHFNSTPQYSDPANVKGAVTFHCYNNSKLLSQTVLDTFCGITGLKNRKAQYGYYKVSRFCEFPSILFETAFISNPEEYEWFTSSSNMDIAATGITAGIVAFFTVQS
ncbi:MAG: hypothetical protein K0S55_876, partial [Clostridia bacterium]|nr:hypothetical protein [Clostridia bacterium]